MTTVVERKLLHHTGEPAVYFDLLGLLINISWWKEHCSGHIKSQNGGKTYDWLQQIAISQKCAVGGGTSVIKSKDICMKNEEFSDHVSKHNTAGHETMIHLQDFLSFVHDKKFLRDS